MALLDDLLARMRAAPELSGIRIVENEAVDDETFLFKVHASILSNSLQIRFLADKNFRRYSFQLYRDRPLLRWDNTRIIQACLIPRTTFTTRMESLLAPR
jgi:hypothetical protein